MKLAIVGSRKINFEMVKIIDELLKKRIRELSPELIISGGAKGVDLLAEEIARELGIEVKSIKPEIHSWDGSNVDMKGYKQRNEIIASECDHLICIRSHLSKSYGSGWTADFADRIGKVVEKYKIYETGLERQF